MKITYTGRQVELSPAHQKKLADRFAKIGKLLDGRRECETHVILSLERHLHHAEATINYYGHQLVGMKMSPEPVPPNPPCRPNPSRKRNAASIASIITKGVSR